MGATTLTFRTYTTNVDITTDICAVPTCVSAEHSESKSRDNTACACSRPANLANYTCRFNSPNPEVACRV